MDRATHVGDVDLYDLRELVDRAGDAYRDGDYFGAFRLLGEVEDGCRAARAIIRDDLNTRAEHAGLTRSGEAPV
jgi:hypothetical protein